MWQGVGRGPEKKLPTIAIHKSRQVAGKKETIRTSSACPESQQLLPRFLPATAQSRHGVLFIQWKYGGCHQLRQHGSIAVLWARLRHRLRSNEGSRRLRKPRPPLTMMEPDMAAPDSHVYIGAYGSSAVTTDRPPNIVGYPERPSRLPSTLKARCWTWATLCCRDSWHGSATSLSTFGRNSIFLSTCTIRGQAASLLSLRDRSSHGRALSRRPFHRRLSPGP